MWDEYEGRGKLERRVDNINFVYISLWDVKTLLTKFLIDALMKRKLNTSLDFNAGAKKILHLIQYMY